MKCVIVAVLLVASMPAISMASAMSPEKSRCVTMESSAEKFLKWRSSFNKYLSSESKLDENTRFELSQKGLRKVLSLTAGFSKASGVRAPVKLMEQAQQLLSDVDEGHIPKASALKVMRSGMIKFEENMDAMMLLAQANNQSCDIPGLRINNFSTSKPASNGVN